MTNAIRSVSLPRPSRPAPASPVAIDLGTTRKSKLTAADGAGWVRLGVVPPAEAIARGKGNGKDDIVVQVGRDVYVASTSHLAGPAAAGAAIELVAPEGERLAGVILHADREAPEPPRPRWKQNVGYAALGAMLPSGGVAIASMSGLLAASFALPAFIVYGASFLALGLATDMRL